MKAITLWQPWATLVALGYKQYETRHWNTNYRGQIAIHAAKRPVKQAELAAIAHSSQDSISFDELRNIEYPLGAVVCTAQLVSCDRMFYGTGFSSVKLQGHIDIHTVSEQEKSVGLWQHGRFAWRLDDVVKLERPVYCKGFQGLWNLSAEVFAYV